MAKNCLKFKSPGLSTNENLTEKLYGDYYGIEFTRNTSNNGGSNGYRKLIGTEESLTTLPVHQLIKLVAVKDAKITQELNQTNIFKDVDGNDVDLAMSDGGDIMQTYGGFYAIMGGTDEVYDRYIVGLNPFSYGNDQAQYISLYAETPDYSTTVSNQQRCIYDTSVAGSMGTQNACITEGFECYKSSAGYPKTSITRFNYELYARNKNDDNTKNVPYANANSLDLSVLMTLMYIECHTKWLTKVFGDAISSNTTPSASTWGTVSGAKITEANGTEHYYALSSTALYIDDGTSNTNVATFAAGEEPLYVTREGNENKSDDGDPQTLALANGTNIWSLIEGGQYPMLQILEAQRDISNGCTDSETSFESVSCPDGYTIQGMDDGIMTGIWTKTMKGKIKCAFSSSATEVAECDMEVVLRQPVWRGRTRLWGNIWSYLSGSENLLYIDGDGNKTNELWQARSIETMATDTDTSNKSNEEDWAFVSTNNYEKLGNTGSTNGWCDELLRTENGVTHPCAARGSAGAKETYEGAYRYFDTTTTTTNVYIRRYVIFGGRANYSTAVLRYASSNYAPSISNTGIGCGFRCYL